VAMEETKKEDTKKEETKTDVLMTYGASKLPNEDQKGEVFRNKGMKITKSRLLKTCQFLCIAQGVPKESLRDSAYQTSTTDRPAVPEDTLTWEEAEGILSETKYETALATMKSRRKKKTVTKEAVSPSLSQRKAKKERRQLKFKEISGTSSSEDDEGNLRCSSTKKKMPKKTVVGPRISPLWSSLPSKIIVTLNLFCVPPLVKFSCSLILSSLSLWCYSSSLIALSTF